MYNKQSGQSLLEVVVVIAVGIIVVSALVFATIASIRNAQFAKNQALATKLAQEGIEKIKTIRDLDVAGSVEFAYRNGSATISTVKFSDLWGLELNQSCNTAATSEVKIPCYFTLVSAPLVQGSTKIMGTNNNADTFEVLNAGMFRRQVQIKDEHSSFTNEKNITVIVRWTDFSGNHESKLTTILRKI